MKEYYDKFINKDLIMNCVKIISIFIIVQLTGMFLAYTLFSNSLTMTLVSIISVNILAYYIALK